METEITPKFSKGDTVYLYCDRIGLKNELIVYRCKRFIVTNYKSFDGDILYRITECTGGGWLAKRFITARIVLTEKRRKWDTN